MKHAIPLEQLAEQIGPQVEAMAQAIEACVHCGFCLATCPTYQVLGEEMDSPRGRIVLMKSVLEGDLNVQETMPFIDRCLGCLACVTACPSGVQYGELVDPFRAYAQGHLSRPLADKLQRSLVRETLPHPDRFRLAAGMGRLAQPLRRALPGQLNGMLDLLPEKLPPARPLPAVMPAEGKRRARVALLAGCVQQVLEPHINWATLRVLSRNGVEVLVPQDQGCCGALMMHTGDQESARKLARHNLHAFPQDVDAILTNAAGCGSGMKAYGLLFKGLPEESSAGDFAQRVQDVSVFLAELGLQTPPSLPQPLKVAYHDACHLAHAQGVREAPRRLLEAIPNVSLFEIPDGELCCGSAGTYNLEQPEIAQVLGERKAQNILQSGGQVVAAGNIGCMVQIATHLHKLGKPLPVYHTLEILDMAYAQAGRAHSAKPHGQRARFPPVARERIEEIMPTALESLQKVLNGRTNALVIPHNDPDPDAIASAVGFRHLLAEKFGVTAHIAYRGIIGRAENKALVRYLGNPLGILRMADLNQDLPVALVDTQPGTGNNPFPAKSSPAIVIDHHTWREETAAAEFADIRPDLGACSTIILDYLQAAGIELPTSLATALFYGIKTDTMGLGRGTHPADSAAYFYLQPKIDMEALGQIENAQVPAAYYKSFAVALGSAQVYDDILIAYIGRMRYPDLGAEMADLFSRLQGVRWVICIGVHENELVLSVRSRSRRFGAGKLVQAIVKEMGTAGGHGTMAAGHIPLSPQLAIQSLVEQLRKNALEYLKGSEDVPAKPLI